MQIVAVCGGWSLLFAVIAVLGLTAGLLAALYRLALMCRTGYARRQAARRAAADLATCQAIAALGTTTHPKQ